MNPLTSTPVLVATRMGWVCSVVQDDVPHAKPHAVRYGREPQTQPPTQDECVAWLVRSRPGFYREVTVQFRQDAPVEAELWEFREEHRNSARVRRGERLALTSGTGMLDLIYRLVLEAPL